MHLAGPVHVNFPFDAPLKPDFAGADLQAMQRAAHDCFALGARNASIAAKDGARLDLGPLVGPAGTCPFQHRGHRAIVAVLFSACRRGLPARPWRKPRRSRLGAQAVAARARRPAVGAAPIDDPLIIDNYDNPAPAPIARPRWSSAGRYPISKSAPPCSSARVPSRWRSMSPDARFQRGDGRVRGYDTPRVRAQRMAPRARPSRFADAWVALNDEARLRILAVEWDGVATHDSEATEGALRALASSAGAGRLVPLSANSMSIRAVDTFYVKDGKPLAVMANHWAEQYRQRVSAVGAAQHFAQTTFSPATSRCCTISPLALPARDAALRAVGGRNPVAGHRALNNGGAILRHTAPGLRRPVLRAAVPRAPGRARFTEAAAALRHPLGQRAHGRRLPHAYEQFLGTPGISLIEVALPLQASRLHAYQR